MFAVVALSDVNNPYLDMEHAVPFQKNYLAWRADEPDGESTYHLELNNVTLHFFKEEWQEFLKLAEIVVDEEL